MQRFCGSWFYDAKWHTCSFFLLIAQQQIRMLEVPLSSSFRRLGGFPTAPATAATAPNVP
jgi:hypothetical protein